MWQTKTKLIVLFFSPSVEFIFLYIYCSFVSQSVSSASQSCLTLLDSMNYSRPGLPVHHKLPEFTQTHVHR